MKWRFAESDLPVLRVPIPGRSGGHRQITFTPPGFDGIAARIPNGRLPVHISVSIEAAGSEALAVLAALFESGASGDLEMPVGNDAWVYEDSFVDGNGPVLWEKTGPDLWRARVTFVCPKPRPTWKSSGERVF